MADTPGAFSEASQAQRPAERQRVLSQRICDLNLRIEGTRLEPLVQQLYAELRAAGLRRFAPQVYLSDEWGCPDRLPLIGVPFFLADERLTRLEEERAGMVEAETDAEIMRYLRHEAGHGFNYAYELYATPEWERLFGPFSRPYVENYTPQAFSQDFVRYLPGWYAQKHPDEDFAETFAVWLDPLSHWREAYQGWRCYSKLEYVDAQARALADVEPRVSAGPLPAEPGLACVLEERYRHETAAGAERLAGLDASLREIFVSPGRPGVDLARPPAAAFLDEHRRRILAAVFYWTGISQADLRSLLAHARDRCAALDLRVPPDGEGALVAITAVFTTLCMNRLYRGEFVPRSTGGSGGGEYR